MKKIFLIFLIISVFMPKNFTAQKSEKEKIYLDEFLTLGPINVQMPVFTQKGKDFFDEKDLLEFEYFEIENLYPEKSKEIFINENKTLQWEEKQGKELQFNLGDKGDPKIIYAASFLETDKFLSGDLNVESCQIFEVFLDGKSIGKKTSFQTGKNCEAQRLTLNVKFETGKHLLMIKSLGNPNSKADWKIKSSIILDDGYSAQNLNVSASSEIYASVKELLEGLKTKSVSISADGKIAAVTLSKVNTEGKSELWIELYDTESKNLIQTLHGGVNFFSVDWAPVGNKFAYTTSEGKKQTLWIADLKAGENFQLIKDVENLSGYVWSPNADFIIYSITDKFEDKNNNIKKYSEMSDRLPWGRDNNFLYLVDVKSGFKKRLTAGSLGTNVADVSPNGRKIIFSSYKQDMAERPYSEFAFYILDIETMVLDSLLSDKYLNSVIWGVDSNKLLFLGGPSAFDGIGKNIPQDKIPNDYDTQAFIYNLQNKEVNPITKNFKPKISSARWINENEIYFSVIDESFNNLYRYKIDESKFEKIELGVESLDEIDFAENSPIAVFTGSDSNTPGKAFLYNFKNDSSTVLLNPLEGKNFVTGKVEDWNFTTEEGNKIKGRIYYPPNFDDSKKYPAIVYYYGGTNPITREFEGRYPKNIWAANGYIVYTLQPFGTTGFGQEYSAYHVNDWGEITSRQIIYGTKKLLNEHKFIDPEKVGCIGASYGGFMTMTLITKTDIFSAAVSHAGISNLANYWGAGYWGVTYSAIAAAESFPWNRKDIYVEKSPLFNADKINTPLLLLHGGSDTNVPTNESIQMFSALNVLGKDVEFVEVSSQDHWIMQYDKRKEWTKTIIAYFDKYLKNQPQWWNEIFN